MWNSCISKRYKAVIRQISPRWLGSACYWLGRENANILMDWFKKCQVICNTSRKSSDCTYKEYKWELERIAKIGRRNKDSVIPVRLVIGILQSSQKHLLLSRTSGVHHCNVILSNISSFPFQYFCALCLDRLFPILFSHHASFPASFWYHWKHNTYYSHISNSQNWNQTMRPSLLCSV